MSSNLIVRVQEAGRGGGLPQGKISSLSVWRFVDVHKALMLMSLRHPERVWKKSLVLQLIFPPSSPRNVAIWRRWDRNSMNYKMERDSYAKLARLEYEDRRTRREENIRINEEGTR